MNNKYLFAYLSGDTSLDPGPLYNNHSLDSNEWNAFKLKRIHLIHLNDNSLLPKIFEICYVPKCTNAVVIRITESKTNGSIFQSKIQIDNYDLLQWDRNRKVITS